MKPGSTSPYRPITQGPGIALSHRSVGDSLPHNERSVSILVHFHNAGFEASSAAIFVGRAHTRLDASVCRPRKETEPNVIRPGPTENCGRSKTPRTRQDHGLYTYLLVWGSRHQAKTDDIKLLTNCCLTKSTKVPVSINHWLKFCRNMTSLGILA